MKQVCYMILYRPKGSTTFTPCTDSHISLNTGHPANFFAFIKFATGVADDLKVLNSENEYAIFKLTEV